ncbi:MAG: helix-turn-helix transcriptional regulator [Candidatus Binataceae bacterium]|jgi:transcriptional regulator with XRE-family HTH domain
MARRPDPNFGRTIRTRRRELDLTLEEVAQRTKASAAFIGHLESGARGPSDKMLGKLAATLRFDTRELFFLAKPGVAELLRSDAATPSLATWDAFRKNEALHRANKITASEMQFVVRKNSTTLTQRGPGGYIHGGVH